jgi:hypothetical protein
MAARHVASLVALLRQNQSSSWIATTQELGNRVGGQRNFTGPPKLLLHRATHGRSPG